MLSSNFRFYKTFTKYYAKTHEWIDIEGKIGKIGITEYAIHNLGEVSAIEVELPKDVKNGDEAGNIEATKATTPFLSPVSGKIFEVNPKVADEPRFMNESPEKDGWICKIEIVENQDLSHLLNHEQYKNFLNSQ